MKETILLAGCGDLGQRLAPRLLARGATVWALRRHPPAQSASGIRWLAADLATPASLACLPTGIDRLVYLPAPDTRSEQAYGQVFIQGLQQLTRSLLDSGHPLQRIVFVSSSAVYGAHDGAWVDERTPPAPAGFNGRILLEAERWLASQAVCSVVLRLAGLYGPGRLQLVERLRQGLVRVPRVPPHWSNRIHIDDAAAALDHLLYLDDPAPMYLGADDTPLPLHELYARLASLAGVAEPPDGPPPQGVGSKRLSNAHLRASGWVPAWPDSRPGYAALLAEAQKLD